MALFSVAQSGGRVITGVVSETALTYETRRCCLDRGIPRTFFFVLASLVTIVAHATIAAHERIADTHAGTSAPRERSWPAAR